MSAPSVLVVVMASMSFYVGSYHLLIYSRWRQHREDLTFALLCLAVGLLQCVLRRTVQRDLDRQRCAVAESTVHRAGVACHFLPDDTFVSS
jgi:hypothetical protein